MSCPTMVGRANSKCFLRLPLSAFVERKRAVEKLLNYLPGFVSLRAASPKEIFMWKRRWGRFHTSFERVTRDRSREAPEIYERSTKSRRGDVLEKTKDLSHFRQILGSPNGKNYVDCNVLNVLYNA
jgi:hypothetical protein